MPPSRQSAGLSLGRASVCSPRGSPAPSGLTLNPLPALARAPGVSRCAPVGLASPRAWGCWIQLQGTDSGLVWGDTAAPTLPPVSRHLPCPPTWPTPLASSACSPQEPSRSPCPGPSAPRTSSRVAHLLVRDRWRGGPSSGALSSMAGVCMRHTLIASADLGGNRWSLRAVYAQVVIP